MAARITVRLEGERELLRKLDQIPAALRTTVLSDTLIKAAKPIHETAESRAPYRTGKLRRSLVVEKTGNKADVEIGVEESAFYGIFVEFGTRYSPAQPFMLPAFHAKKHAATNIARREFGAIVLKEARG